MQDKISHIITKYNGLLSYEFNLNSYVLYTDSLSEIYKTNYSDNNLYITFNMNKLLENIPINSTDKELSDSIYNLMLRIFSAFSVREKVLEFII